MKLHISNGNSKLGKIPNISGVPVKDCPKICLKTCSKECYALKALKMYPAVRKAWGENSQLLRKSKREYFKQLRDYLDKKQPAYFRFHVAGDITSAMHAGFIVDTATKYPETKFLVFTKNYEALKYIKAPKNLTIVISVWEGMKAKDLPQHVRKYARAYAGDCSNFKGFKDSIECPGVCDNCLACWGLGKKGLNVKFTKH